MTEYTPFQEPQGTDVEVLRRRVWEELRRIGGAVTQLNEIIVSTVGVGAYGFGWTDDVTWTPGTTSPTDATRIPIETISASKNMVETTHSIQPQEPGDYYFDIRLIFAPNQNNRTWNIGVFNNDVLIGNSYQYNSRDYPEINVQWNGAGTVLVGDDIDVRLWPNGASDTGSILEYTYAAQLLGL